MAPGADLSDYIRDKSQAEGPAPIIQRSPPRSLQAGVNSVFDRAIKEALKLARGKKADYLPGWCDPTED